MAAVVVVVFGKIEIFHKKKKIASDSKCALFKT